MTDDRKLVWAVVGAIVLVLAIVLFSERVQRELRPDPVAAYVAFQPAGEEVARVGRVEELASGREFTMHAVLEARGLGGRRVFFTEAPALEVDGELWQGESLRVWAGPEKAKVLWFSVEGPRPKLELEEGDALSDFRLGEVYRSDWPRAWSIPGSVRPFRDESAPGSRILAEEPFGTLRFRVRIELFGSGSELVPVAVQSSPPPQDAFEHADRYPTVIATLPGALALPSRVFGLTLIDLPSSVLQRELDQLEAWFEADLAYSYLLLLRAMVDRAGVEWEELRWREVEVGASPPWGDGSPATGDLLRAGERIVVLYEDRGLAGRLDYEDLCFDFADGAEIRRLEDVFSGEGLVEWTGFEPRGEGERS